MYRTNHHFSTGKKMSAVETQASPIERATTQDCSVEQQQAVALKLENTWTMYAHVDSDNYATGIVSLNTFSTVYGFWQLYNNLPPLRSCFAVDKRFLVNNMKVNALSLFKDMIMPAWEDPKNMTGGEWIVKMQSTESLADLWQSLCLSAIGELFPDELTGIRIVHKVIKERCMLKFEVWLSNMEKDVVDSAFSHINDLISGANDIKFQPHHSL